MFGVTARRQFLLPLRSNTGNFETTLTAALCGETRLRCRQVSIQDVFGLFRFSCAPFAEVRTLLYPQPVNVQLLFSQNTVGSVSAEGLMQNRRGSDPAKFSTSASMCPAMISAPFTGSFPARRIR